MELEDVMNQFHDTMKNVENQSQQVLQRIEGRSYEFWKRLIDISENCLEVWNERLFNSNLKQLENFEHSEG